MSRWFRKRLLSVKLDVCLFFFCGMIKIYGFSYKNHMRNDSFATIVNRWFTNVDNEINMRQTYVNNCLFWPIVFSYSLFMCDLYTFFVSLCTCFYGQYFILIWLNGYIDRWKMQTFTWMNRIPHAFEKHSQKNVYMPLTKL